MYDDINTPYESIVSLGEAFAKYSIELYRTLMNYRRIWKEPESSPPGRRTFEKKGLQFQ